MKLFYKTLGWACISGIIFFVSAILNSCPWQGALTATIIATMSKTPAYPVWETIFESCWRKNRAAKTDKAYPIQFSDVGACI